MLTLGTDSVTVGYMKNPMKPSTYTAAEAEAIRVATEQNRDVPIYRLYKSGKYTIDRPDPFDRKGFAVEYTVHGTIAGGK